MKQVCKLAHLCKQFFTAEPFPVTNSKQRNAKKHQSLQKEQKKKRRRRKNELWELFLRANSEQCITGVYIPITRNTTKFFFTESALSFFAAIMLLAIAPATAAMLPAILNPPFAEVENNNINNNSNT